MREVIKFRLFLFLFVICASLFIALNEYRFFVLKNKVEKLESAMGELVEVHRIWKDLVIQKIGGI